MRTSIELKNGTAFIEIGNSDISGEYVTSPNGRYFMICDTLYAQSGNAREYAFVFTKDEVCYKKLIPNDEGGEWFFVFDDGQSLILTSDNVLIRLDSTGNQLTKRKVPDIDTDSVGIIGPVFYGVGSDDDGCTLLFVYDLESGRAVSRTVPDIEYDDDDTDDLLSSDVEWAVIGDRFVFVYDNGIDAVAFDLHGTAAECLQSDIEEVNRKRTQKEIARKEQRTRKCAERPTLNCDYNNTATQPNTESKTILDKPTEHKKIPTWVIILIIAIVVLALIGKYVA